MPVYILTHPSKDFSGVMAGVDFFHGKGSTSSLADAHMLAQLKNCGVAVRNGDGTETAVDIVRTEKEHLPESYAAVPVKPNTDTPQAGGGVEASAPSPGLSTARAELKAVEDNPDSPPQQALAARIRAKAKAGERRRKQ